MPAFGLNIELDIDTTAVSDISAVTFNWFDAMSQIAFGDARKALDGEGPTPVALPYMEPEAWNPSRAPVQLRSSIEVSRKRSKSYSAKSWAWLRQQLADDPEQVDVSVWLTAGSEPDSPNVWYPSLYASRRAESPGWVRLGAYVAESSFLDSAHGADIQRQWLSGVRTFADRLNPGFGQIEYGYDTFGTTGLEFSLPPSIDLEERRPYYTVGKCRQYLRGYSWLTVVAAELAERLGGQEAMRHTGAFAEAADLQNGGLWLLATEDYRDYGPAQVERVFRALAPVLRPGTPESTSYITDAPPQRLVLQNAADAH
jgi:hypothetical protein